MAITDALEACFPHQLLARTTAPIKPRLAAIIGILFIKFKIFTGLRA
jgi:hypothetical protein